MVAVLRVVNPKGTTPRAAAAGGTPLNDRYQANLNNQGDRMLALDRQVSACLY